MDRLEAVDPSLPSRVEEEVVDPYKAALIRLKAAGMELEWPLRRIYEPTRSTPPS